MGTRTWRKPGVVELHLPPAGTVDRPDPRRRRRYRVNPAPANDLSFRHYQGLIKLQDPG